MASTRVCSVDDLQVGDMKAFKVAGEKILLYRLEEGFFATQSRCTHLYASMERGKIVEGCRVQCPFHRAQFDIRSGEVVKWANFPPGVQLLNSLRPEKALVCFKTEVKGPDVCVDIAPLS